MFACHRLGRGMELEPELGLGLDLEPLQEQQQQQEEEELVDAGNTMGRAIRDCRVKWWYVPFLLTELLPLEPRGRTVLTCHSQR